MDEHCYDDIIDLPHHVSLTHPRMSRSDRAAQFSPFAALTGYSDAIREVERRTDSRAVLGEEELACLDDGIRRLIACESSRPEVSLTFFEPDARKAGGAYRNLRGRVRRVDEIDRTLHLEDGTALSFDALVRLEFIGPEE